ncbi:CDP-diacylglycerol---serine O-phosphatidyltransferase [Mariniphaga anaerophila]|uniref:CDP-diacylglycerol---serine O-phosphatidyltransferase n=1 Tax=Mariniphaga anaerophila TaxID=1484053 RepID=A0A1M5E1U3_9BACT|nr:CDP-alcohol phosphatidyltransferase family protein [Mariniphaga anaerophila]SHF73042.1 CDP-diacylglycerol---serine O-phosphatidyltransferase [Mariniphaga anaerophila]
MNRIVKQIPNFITSLNLASGSMAVIFALDGHLVWAGIFICLAAVFDFLDGFSARLLKAYSEIGKQLDSLSDLISFGLAPAAILFTLLEFSMFEKNQPIYQITASWDQWLILFSALIMPVLGAVRLARFNVSQADEPFFRGLPIPANGIFWASVGLMLEVPRYQELFQAIFSTRTLCVLGLFFSGMMVITMPMFSLKAKNLNIKENWYRYVFLFITLILLVTLNVYGLAISILTYILLNIGFYLAGIKY